MIVHWLKPQTVEVQNYNIDEPYYDKLEGCTFHIQNPHKIFALPSMFENCKFNRKLASCPVNDIRFPRLTVWFLLKPELISLYIRMTSAI